MKSLGNFPDPFIAEIAGQPDALRRAAAAAIRQETALSQAATVATRGSLVFAGMGSSYDGCYPAVSDLAAAGVPALMLDAAELLHFRLAILAPEDLLVLVSQSGESAETVAVAQALRSRRRPPTIVSITNGLGNTLSELADVALDTDAGKETGPSTMTFAASLVLLARARPVDHRRHGRRRSPAPRSSPPRASSDSVAQEDLPPQLAAWHGGRATTVILGRGAARAAAEMGALTLKEAVGIGVESLQAAQFRHGPLELAGPDLAAIVIATEPETAELDLGLAADLCGLGAAVLVIGATDAELSGVETVADRRPRPAPGARGIDRARAAARVDPRRGARADAGHVRPRREGDDP